MVASTHPGFAMSQNFDGGSESGTRPGEVFPSFFVSNLGIQHLYGNSLPGGPPPRSRPSPTNPHARMCRRPLRRYPSRCCLSPPTKFLQNARYATTPNNSLAVPRTRVGAPCRCSSHCSPAAFVAGSQGIGPVLPSI